MNNPEPETMRQERKNVKGYYISAIIGAALGVGLSYLTDLIPEKGLLSMSYGSTPAAVSCSSPQIPLERRISLDGGEDDASDIPAEPYHVIPYH